MSNEKQIRIVNHQTAFWYMRKCIARQCELTEDIALHAHSILMNNTMKYNGAYRSGSDKDIFIRGTSYEPPEGKDIPLLMKNYWSELQRKSDLLGMPEIGMSVVELAAYAHAEFESIHPFFDGNGRTGRFILNYILMKNGLYPINVMRERENEYFRCLEQYQSGSRCYEKISRDYSRLADFIMEEEEGMVNAASLSETFALKNIFNMTGNFRIKEKNIRMGYYISQRFVLCLNL